MVAVELSSRAVSVASTAVSSRSTATTTELASRTPASVSASVDVALPDTAARPCAVARARASALSSSTTICSRDTPFPIRVRTALLPLVPYPQMITCSFKVLLHLDRL